MSFAHSFASTTCVSGNTRRSPVDVAVAVAVACLEQLSHAFLVADGARLAFGIRGLRHLLSLRGQLPLGHPATYRYPSRPRSSSSSASSPFNPRHICDPIVSFRRARSRASRARDAPTIRLPLLARSSFYRAMCDKVTCREREPAAADIAFDADAMSAKRRTRARARVNARGAWKTLRGPLRGSAARERTTP